MNRRHEQSGLIAGACLVGALAIVALRVIWIAVERWLA